MKQYKSLYPALVLMLLAGAILYQSRFPRVGIHPGSVKVVSEAPPLVESRKPRALSDEELRQPQRSRVFFFKIYRSPKTI